jgi:hypothetical protein
LGEKDAALHRRALAISYNISGAGSNYFIGCTFFGFPTSSIDKRLAVSAWEI